MTLRPLTLPELKKLYREELTVTFPPSELRPLFAMKRMIHGGIYEPLGIYEGAQRIGYALLWKDEAEGYVLIDYFGISPELRGMGLGTRALGLVAEHCESYAGILVEAEAPGLETEAGYQLRSSRLEFYLRSGFVLMEYDCALFGVHYKVLLLPKGKVSRSGVMVWHRRLYQRHLPAIFFHREVQIPLEKPL